MKKILFLICCTAVITLNAATPKNAITVGTAPEKFIVEQITGKRFTIQCIMPQGKNMHDFTAGPLMMKNAAQSRIFFHTGVLFEEQIADAIHKGNTKVVNIADNIPKLQMKLSAATDKTTYIDDIHTWFSYENLINMANEVLKTLCDEFPQYASDFKKNHENFKFEIEKSKAESAKKLRRFAGRTFLTHHAAFGYFAHEFNLQQLPFEFNGREITPRHAAELSKYAKTHNVKRIFIQSSASGNVRRALSSNTNAELTVINPADYNILDSLNRFAAELEAAFE